MYGHSGTFSYGAIPVAPSICVSLTQQFQQISQKD